MTARNTTIRDRHRATLRRQGGPCGICGEPIDYTLPHLDPLSFVVDHVHPLHLGGPDTLENKVAAHRACNRAKGAKTMDQASGAVTFVTWRTWSPNKAST